MLIDELNSATDPEEGAALGRAFLETVMAHGAIIVTTTHDPHLKATAVSDHRILNASMQFDEQARTPTYRMILGVPGRSRALETAERLGISSDVLTLARKYLSREHIEFEAMLAKLEQDAREADRARREAEHLRAEAERMHKEWTERTETAVGEMLDRTRQRLRRILEAAQDEVRASVRKLDEAKNRHEIDKTRAQLNESLTLASERMESALTEEAPEIADALAYKAKARAQEPAKAPKLETGTAVRIPKWKSTGTILEITGNRAKVSMGTIQMSLALSDIEPLSALEISALPKSRPKPSSGGSGATSFVPESRLDLRGVRFEEAMSELQRYLDLVFRSGALMEVTIVHGMGTGALREGTRKILSSLPYIKNYRDGGVGLGGAGATLVEIDRD